MADLGDNFLQGYFKTMEMRQNMVNRQTQAQQFAQDLALRQQEAQLRQKQFEAQQGQWAETMKDKESLRAEQSRKEQLAEKMDLAKGLASGQLRLPGATPNPLAVPQMQDSVAAPTQSPMIQRVPNPNGGPPSLRFAQPQAPQGAPQINTDQTEAMSGVGANAPTFQLAGQNVRLTTPEELAQAKNEEAAREHLALAKQGADRFSAFQDQARKTLGAAYQPSDEDNQKIYSFFAAGGGTPGTELAKLLEGKKGAAAGLGGKLTTDELYAFNAQNADPVTKHVYDTIKSNPKAMEDPKFVAQAMPVLAAAQKKIEHLKAISAATSGGIVNDRNSKINADFNRLNSRMKASNLYTDPAQFNKDLRAELSNNNYEPEAVSRFVNINAAADKRVKPSLLEQLGLGAPPSTEAPR